MAKKIILMLFMMVTFCSCFLWARGGAAPGKASTAGKPAAEKREDRDRMVSRQIERRGIVNPAVLEAMRNVPRHSFVPEGRRYEAYEDYPLPIGYGQTISQPYIVAYMTELLNPKPEDKTLEVGTGSGYQAAVLADIVSEVCTVEIIPELLDIAAERFSELGLKNIRFKAADGYYGWPEEAPFDGIMVTAAAEHIPPALIAQLKPGGRLVIPVGSPYAVQTIILLEKGLDGRVERKPLLPVRFVPMTGAAQTGVAE